MVLYMYVLAPHAITEVHSLAMKIKKTKQNRTVNAFGRGDGKVFPRLWVPPASGHLITEGSLDLLAETLRLLTSPHLRLFSWTVHAFCMEML